MEDQKNNVTNVSKEEFAQLKEDINNNTEELVNMFLELFRQVNLLEDRIVKFNMRSNHRI